MSRSFIRIIKFAVTALLLGLVIRIAGANDIMTAFGGIIWLWAIVMLISGVLGKLVVSIQLWAILSRGGLTISVFRVFLANALAALYTLALPGNLASAGAKWLDLSAATGKKAAVFNALIYHRLLMSLLTLAFGVAALAASNILDYDFLHFFAVAILVLLMALFVLLYHPRLGAWAETTIRRISTKLPERAAGFVIPVVDAMRRFHGFSVRNHMEVLAWAIASVTLRVLMLWFAMLAMQIDVSPVHILWISAFLLFTAALPLTVANLGIREGLLVVALAPFGVSPPTAVALGLLIFVNQIAFAAVGGAYQFALVLGLVRWRMPSETPADDQVPDGGKHETNSV
jgi:uncharacterized membrane protein YbhN (UPF0104 family)